MNLTLHHFRKEARYLLPRWWLLVAALLVELLLNLEWISPMRLHGADWPAWAPLGPWGTAVVVALSESHEEAVKHRFTITRPLPTVSYWAARALIFVIMIALPFAIQEGAYLALSHRPWDEVIAGAGERAATVVGLLGWLLPLSAVWHGWHRVVAAATLVMAFCLSLEWLFFRPYGSFDAVLFMWHSGLGVAAVVTLSLLAWFHRRWNFKGPTLVSAHVISAMGLAWLCYHWPAPSWMQISTDQAKAESLAKQVRMNVPMESVGVAQRSRSPKANVNIFGEVEVEGLPPAINFFTYPVQSRATEGRGALSLLAPENRYDPVPQMFMLNSDYFIKRATAIQSNLEPGTVLAIQGGHDFREGRAVDLATFEPPAAKLKNPIQITTDSNVEWEDWTSELRLPVRPGASGVTRDAKWTIESVRWDQNAIGETKLGGVAIDYRVESKAGFVDALGIGSTLIMVAPDRHVAWTPPSRSGLPFVRAVGSHWSRRLETIAWPSVLRYADGEVAEMDRDKLQVIVIQPRHLGTTRWRLESPPFKLADYTTEYTGWGYSTDEGLYRGGELAAFAQRLASLPEPAAVAPNEVVTRYLWDVLSAAAALKFDPKEAPPKLREALSAMAKHHLGVMLRMPDGMASKWAELLAEILSPLVTDDHKSDLLKRLPEQPWLAPIVNNHGWISDAVPVVEPLLKKKDRLDANLRKLLLNSNDERVLRLLLENFRQNPQHGYEIIDKLVRMPSMRAEVKAVADELWTTFDPTLQRNQDNRLRLQIKFGNPEALEMALRIASLGAEWGGDQRRLCFDLAPLLSLPAKPKDSRIPDLAASYRHLKAADFEYQTDKMLWKKRTP